MGMGKNLFRCRVQPEPEYPAGTGTGTGIPVRLYWNRITVLKNPVPFNRTDFLSQSSGLNQNFYRNSGKLVSSHKSI